MSDRRPDPHSIERRDSSRDRLAQQRWPETLQSQA